jgi:hypothetical protein
MGCKPATHHLLKIYPGSQFVVHVLFCEQNNGVELATGVHHLHRWIQSGLSIQEISGRNSSQEVETLANDNSKIQCFGSGFGFMMAQMTPQKQQKVKKISYFEVMYVFF